MIERNRAGGSVAMATNTTTFTCTESATTNDTNDTSDTTASTNESASIAIASHVDQQHAKAASIALDISNSCHTMPPAVISAATSWAAHRSPWMLWINLLLLVFPGHLVEAKIGYFWHISDLHLDSAYSAKGDVTKSCWHYEHGPRTAASRQPGQFGDYMCDSPWALLESATQAMKARQGDNVEFVLWTGDGLSHSTRRLIEQHRLELLRNITELLGRTFSSQFVFPVLGHEDSQGNSLRHLGELWRHWLPSEALQTFEKGGYYTIEQTKSRLRIIVLNTNFMRHNMKSAQVQPSPVRQRTGHGGGSGNGGGGGGGGGTDFTDYREYQHGYGGHHNGGGHYRQGNERTIYGRVNGVEHGGAMVSALSGSGGGDHEAQKQWDWLKAVLEKSRKNKETVYIVGHMPPGSDERQPGSLPNGHTTFSKENNAQYLELVREYSNIIRGQFFGHLHSDSFRIIYDKFGTPVSWIMMAPSVSPRKANVGSNNPALRLYKFDTDTGQVLDYTQYYLDLAAANSLGEAVWQPEYNLTTQYFGSGEVTAVALHNLADRFQFGEGPLFAKYYRANAVRYPSGACEGVCALHHFCTITQVDYDQHKVCLKSAATALASSSKSAASSISHTMLLGSALLATLVHILWLAERCSRPLAALGLSLGVAAAGRPTWGNLLALLGGRQPASGTCSKCKSAANSMSALTTEAGATGAMMGSCCPAQLTSDVVGLAAAVAAAAAVATPVPVVVAATVVQASCSRPHNSMRLAGCKAAASSIFTRSSLSLSTGDGGGGGGGSAAAPPPSLMPLTNAATDAGCTSNSNSSGCQTAINTHVTMTMWTTTSTSTTTTTPTPTRTPNINICQSRHDAAPAATVVVRRRAASSSFSVKMHESAKACRTSATPTITATPPPPTVATTAAAALAEAGAT